MLAQCCARTAYSRLLESLMETFRLVHRNHKGHEFSIDEVTKIMEDKALVNA